MRFPSCYRPVILAAVAVALVACASATPKFFFEAHEFDPELWVPKVDRFVLIVDDSLSMSDRDQKEIKLDTTLALARSLNASIPELDYDAGLRSFGQGRCLPRKQTSMLTGIERYSTQAFTEAIDQIDCAGGYSPLHVALEAGLDDLAGADGRVAVIVLSDGRHMGSKTVTAARRLKERFGDEVCIFPILIGDDSAGARLLQRIAEIGGCGELLRGSDLVDRVAMGDLVKLALIDPDSDGDGVADHLDDCPDTPRGVDVDGVGCPIDSDGDGVPDYLDRCPDTPRGTKVDEHGCPIKPKRPPMPPWPIAGAPLFKVDQWALDADDKVVLDEVAQHLADSPDVVIEIQGHTDSTGPMRWNMTLSEWRAESAKKYLIKKGVAEDQLTTKGYGPDKPVAPNDSSANRAKNRRVAFVPAWR